MKQKNQVANFFPLDEYDYGLGFGLLTNAGAPCKEDDSLDCYQDYPTEGIYTKVNVRQIYYLAHLHKQR